MEYKFYLGPSGSGKTRKIHEDIINLSLKDKDRQIIVITPDQYTMQTQRDIILSHPNKAMTNIEIFSFSRLANNIIKDTLDSERLLLDDTGKNLILRKLSIDKAAMLPNLGKNLDKQGFIHEVKSVISEFMQYGITVNDLDNLINLSDNKPSLKGRLKDIAVLYKEFMLALQDKYLTIEEKLSVLSRAIPDSDFVKDSIVVFDGFTGFTPVQGQVISSILSVAKQCWLSFTTDKAPYNIEKPEISLFSLTMKSISYINTLAKQVGAKKLDDLIFSENKRLSNNKELLFLEENLFRNNKGVYDMPLSNITLKLADNPKHEVIAAASSIKRFIDMGNKYQDIAVLTGDLERYAPYVNEIFNAYEIPFFMDTTRKVTLNPYTEFIKSAIDIIISDFSYDSIVHFLHSGLISISDEDIDAIDNYIVARGISGAGKWKKTFTIPASYMKERIDKVLQVTENTKNEMARINEIRKAMLDILAPIADMEKGKKYKATFICEAIQSLLDNEAIKEKLDAYIKHFENNGDFAREKEYSQIADKVLLVFGQIEELIADEELDLNDFIKIFEAGISEIKIGVLPLGMDYVHIGDIERSRLKKVKAVYFIGLNDGVIPKAAANGGLISDLDRDFFEKLSVELSPSPRQKMINQKLYLYMNMTKPSEILYLSYSRKDAKGKSLRPSYLVNVLETIFPKLEKEVVNINSSFSDVYSVRDCGQLLSSTLREYVISCDPAKVNLSKTVTLLNLLKERDSILAGKIVNAAYSDIDESLAKNIINKKIVEALYGATIVHSISRLEKYAVCAYNHFLTFGMNLKEREKAEFGNLDLGNVIHDILRDFFFYLDGKSWRDVEEDYVSDFVKVSLNKYFSEYKDNIAGETARTAYQFKRLERILIRTIMNMSYHLKKGMYDPKEAEIEFFDEIGEKTIANKKMLMQGKIDRIDLCEDQDKVYVKVVDYKSSDKKIDLLKLYNGSQLQLMVYLDEAVKLERKKYKNKELLPAAAFYYHVYDPVISASKDLEDEELSRLLREELRDSGLFVADEKYIDNLDGSLKDSISSQYEKTGEDKDVVAVSDVIKAKLKSLNGSAIFDSGDGINSNNLKTLMDYSKYKAKDLAKEMLDGNIGKGNSQGIIDKKDCEYCAFWDICEKEMPSKKVKDELSTLSSKDLIEKMIEKMNENLD